ncbi:hypothetical protein BASA81_006906 [Batrachochytrium salamandrivorans]|nr:hypothetical protein BASA81_006906 [Batrachochytrium salamandrivorans]
MGCAASRPNAPRQSSVPEPVAPAAAAQLKVKKQGSSSSDPAKRLKSNTHRERVVFAKGFSEALVFEKIPKSDQDVATILTLLDKCYLFSNLSREQREDLCSYVRQVNLKQGELVSQSQFSGIELGEFELQTAVGDGGNEDAPRKRFCAQAKEPFWGEMSLMFEDVGEKPAILVCVSPQGGKLWSIDRDTFRQVIASSNQQQREEKKLAVGAITLLKNSLLDDQLNRLIEAVHLLRFPAGHEIVRKGEAGEVCYFIKQGSVLCSRIGENQLGQVELGQGSYFGERALLRDEPRAADVHAITDVVVMCITRRDFDELLGPLRSVMDANMKERVVESLPILKELNPRLRQEVVADFELESFTMNEQIVKQGEVNVDKFYVVRAGVVRVLENGLEIAVLREGNWFGEMALLNDEPRVASCIACSPVVELFVLRKATFQTLVHESKILNSTNEHRKSLNLLRRTLSSSNSSCGVKTPPTPTAKKMERRVVNSLQDLERLHILGKGTFGTVYLVSHFQQFYALKSMNKANLVRCEQKSNVMNEKQILIECDSHPFVLELFQTFQDRDTLYMLLEFVQGGELFSIMQEKFRFPLYATIFYSACIVDVFEHIHALGVVYRDLKPENVLIDRWGYVKLADFGFAKRVVDKTYTLCGTPEYLAPEVVLGSGHDKGVDYWGVGILIYEMLVGMSPFADEYDDDQHVVCNNIVRSRVGFDKLHAAIRDTESPHNKPKGDDKFWILPSQPCFVPQPPALQTTNNAKRGGGAVYVEAEDLIKRLLNKSPVQRLGNLKDGAREVKQHAFFTPAVFDPLLSEEDNNERLRTRRVPAPYVPAVSSADDSSRFDRFEPDTAWPAYKGSQDWCQGF